MSRRRPTEGGSLDLLLDTVCNTFGSLIFLALLVSLLLARTSRTPSSAHVGTRPAVSPADITRLRGKLARTEAMAVEVRSLLDDYRMAVSRISSADIVAALEELAALRNRADEREAEQARLLMGTVELQATTAAARAAALQARKDADRAASEAAEARARLEDATRERARLTRDLARTQATAGVTARATSAAPRERPTSKQEFGILLRYGRMYLMHHHSGSSRALNSEDFLIVPGSRANEARARPAAGIPLAGTGAEKAIAARLRRYPTATWYACVIVHPDSFEEFQVLKSWLVKNGHEYRLMPTNSSVTDAGEVEARVQ